jgi:hypothetical protein
MLISCIKRCQAVKPLEAQEAATGRYAACLLTNRRSRISARRSNALVLFRPHARGLAVAVGSATRRTRRRGRNVLALEPAWSVQRAAAFGADCAVTIQKTTRTDAILERT